MEAKSKKMAEGKKERVEVLLEDIKGDVKAIAEGHGIIRLEMQEMKNELKEDIKEGNDKLIFVAKELGEKINRVEDKLDQHMRQPVHD